MKEILIKLESILEDSYVTEKIQLESLVNGVNFQNIHILYLMQDNRILYYFFVKNDVEKTKQIFYLKARIAEILINHFNHYLFDYDFSASFAVFMSDSPELIKRYPLWNWTGMESSIKGEKAGAIVSNIMQLIIKEDWQGASERLETLDKLIIKKQNQWLELDYQYFKALISKDNKLVEQILNEFVSPKIHKKRNRNFPLIGELISLPAYGYTKLAWLKGLSVNVNSLLVPKELLPISPLGSYENTYDFLKNYK